MDAIRRNPLFMANQTNSRLRTLVAKVERAQVVAITQTRVHAPSDASDRWSQIHGLQSYVADQKNWQSNLERAQGWYDTAESTLGQVGITLQQAMERAVQLSSGTYGEEQWQAAVGEIRELRSSLVSAANLRVGDRYLFAGDDYGSPAFDEGGAYQGSAATGQIQIGPGDYLDATFDGSQIFQGGLDVFQVMDQFESALSSNDPDAVAGVLTSLHDAHTQIVRARQELGNQQDRISDTSIVSQNLTATLEEQLNDILAVDPVEAYSELLSFQTSYEAALQVISKSSGSKLFDMLR